jgi:hypothetical protein
MNKRKKKGKPKSCGEYSSQQIKKNEFLSGIPGLFECNLFEYDRFKFKLFEDE